MLELREVVCNDILKRRNTEVDPDNILIVPGGKVIIFFSSMLLGDQNREILYPNPGFPIYESAIRFSGAKPVPYPLRENVGFSFSAEDILDKINEKTSLIIINSPSNPTGGIIPKDEIDKFIDSRKKPLLEGLQPKDIALPVTKSLVGNLNNRAAIEELVSSMSKLHKESYLKTIDTSMSTFHDHVFPKIDVPTLILVGEKDTLTPPSMALEIHKLIKNSKFSIIEEAGHLINIENPKAFNYKVLQFLKKFKLML